MLPRSPIGYVSNNELPILWSQGFNMNELCRINAVSQHDRGYVIRPFVLIILLKKTVEHHQLVDHLWIAIQAGIMASEEGHNRNLRPFIVLLCDRFQVPEQMVKQGHRRR